MKTKTILITFITLALLATSRANLIDLTPGGFDETQPFPTVVANFFQQYGQGMQNLAGANIINGQVVWSPFTIFGDDRFDLVLNSDGTLADVAWDLNGSGYRGLFVFVESSEFLANLYLIPGGQRFEGTGTIEINGIIPIGAFTATGTNRPVPDSGTTWELMAMCLGGLFVFKRRCQN